jgi:hypothetical protein
VYLRDKLVLVEMTSLLENEEITPRLGGSTDMFMGSHFPVQKMVEIGQSFS